MAMTREMGLDMLEKQFKILSEDGIGEVVVFAGLVEIREKNPETLKGKLDYARERLELLIKTEPLVENLARQGNRPASVWLRQLRTELTDQKEELKRCEVQWRKFIETEGGTEPCPR